MQTGVTSRGQRHGEAYDKFKEVSIGCGLRDALKGFILPSEGIQEPNRY